MGMSQLLAICDLVDSNTDRAIARREIVQTARCALSGTYMLYLWFKQRCSKWLSLKGVKLQGEQEIINCNRKEAVVARLR